MSADLLHPKYRADIDGLRAVAILAVVGFHAFPTYVPGGFIGVDIFFVISGFLISTIIIKNLECGSFDFVEFYRRRVHRIFPALLLVLIVSGAFAWFALLADEFMQLGKHVASGAAFASNFVLWSEVDYFDNASSTKPLLHLWSLGVEEQFYLVWPFLLWLAWRVGKGLLAMTLITAAASFGLNLFLFRSDSVATFYMPLTRLWEFHAGALVAYVFLHKKQVLSACRRQGVWVRMMSFFRAIPVGGGFHRDLMSLLGAMLIAYGLFGLASDAAYPGWNALLPVFGAALLIVAGANAWINKTILSRRVFVWIGLISYPLYLWHWPLLSFVQIIEGRVPHRDARITAVLLAVLLAWLTYKYVENPIRLGSRSKRKTVLLSLVMLLVGLAGTMVYALQGVKSRAAANLEMANIGDIGDHAYYKYLFVLRNNPGVGLIDVAKYLCDERRCYLARDGVLLYRDSNHLNIDGSLYIGRQIVGAHPELQ